jgi:hypothetical protein
MVVSKGGSSSSTSSSSHSSTKQHRQQEQQFQEQAQDNDEDDEQAEAEAIERVEKEEEGEVFALDEHGRPAGVVEGKGERKMNYSIRSFPSLIPNVNDSLRRDCRIMFDAKRQRESDPYSVGSTYFVPAQMKPRCALEQMAQEIFEFHSKNVIFDPQRSGAEWWTQVSLSRARSLYLSLALSFSLPSFRSYSIYFCLLLSHQPSISTCFLLLFIFGSGY